MARKVEKKFVIQSKLVATSPISVSGGEPSKGIDIPLIVDGLDRLFIPGTSMAGAFRAYVESKNKKAGESLFGDQDNASWITVEDGLVELPEGASPELRSGVGIDRRYGSAVPEFKYERQVLPVGTGINLQMEIDVGPGLYVDESSVIEALNTLVCGLKNEEIQLGAGKTRGLGWVKLDNFVKIQVYDFNTKEDLFAWLNQKDGKGFEVRCDKRMYSDVEITMEIDPDNTEIMMKGPIDGYDIDILPQFGHAGNNSMCAVIAGSSIKGAMRAHAERIIRTLKGISEEEDFDKQIDIPLVRLLFGSKDNAGWLKIRDVYGNIGIDINKVIEEDFTGWGEKEDHVAIDRFTGGAVDGALYSLLRPPQDWQEIRMSLKIPADKQDILGTERDVEEIDKVLKAFLLFVVRDMVDGLIPIGFGATRGLGKLGVKKARVVFNELQQEVGIEKSKGILIQDSNFKEKLLKAWQKWVQGGSNE